jgi:L-ascorbate metabolism protein UlaG (beta-lactamase superfamily)
MDMKLIPMRTKLDLAILPMGITLPWMLKMLLSQLILNCDKILGYHYDTFGYIKIDHKKPFSGFDKGKI